MTCDILDVKPTRSLLFVAPGHDPNGYFRWVYEDVVRDVAEGLRIACHQAQDIGTVPPKFHRQLEELQRYDLAVFLLDQNDPNVTFRLGLRYAHAAPLITLHTDGSPVPGDLLHTDPIAIAGGAFREESRKRLKLRICEILLHPDSCTGRPLLEMMRDGLVTPRTGDGRLAPLHRINGGRTCSKGPARKGRFG